MPPLPDLEAWAIFAKIAQFGSLSRAANDLDLSKATVSKTLARLERRLGTPLLHRNSRHLSLTESGRLMLDRASRLLAEGETMEAEMTETLAAPQGLVRITAPLSFGIRTLGDILPEFLRRYPQVTVDLQLSDRMTDLIAEGIDVALRIGVLKDSALRARRLLTIRRPLVASPAYLERHGHPAHPCDLAAHQAVLFSHLAAPSLWPFDHPELGSTEVRVRGHLLLDNGDVAVEAILAGVGVCVIPEFLVWKELREGRLQELLLPWAAPPIALHIVTPPNTVRSARVRVLTEFLAQHFIRVPWARPDSGETT